MGGHDRHVLLEQPALDTVLLHRVHRPLGHARGRRHKRHATAGAAQQLGQDAAHVVVVVVVEQDVVAVGQRAVDQIVRREHGHRVVERHRRRVPAGGDVSAPARTGRDGDVVEAV